jgi:hypothetical protein
MKKNQKLVHNTRPTGAAPGGDTAAQVRRARRGEHKGEATIALGNTNGARAH